MATFVKINGQVAGPFSDGEIQQKLGAGIISSSTPAWRMGMAEWTTLGVLFPGASQAAAGRRPTPPPLPGAPQNPEPSIGETLAFINALYEQAERGPGSASRPYQPDAFARLCDFAGALRPPLLNALGRTARPTTGYYAHRFVTTALQRLRLDVLHGATLTSSGEVWAARCAAYLAMLAVVNWQRRGLRVRGRFHFEPGSADNDIFFAAERERDGQTEVYAHDFLKDFRRLLLQPPQSLPYAHSLLYVIDSLVLPSPEQLYLFGACTLNSPHTIGNWPKTRQPGGLPEDLQRSKELLMDDLHEDCGLPKDDAGLRRLSLWVVFPPYGWMQNDGGDYNMMTLFSQISEHHVVPKDVGIEYLRALLRSQAVDIRNLGARCLMVYRVPPRDWTEASHYELALSSRDHDMAAGSMAKYQHQIEEVEATSQWREQVEKERRAWVAPEVLCPWRSSPVFSDPDYLALDQLPEDRLAEVIQRLETLMRHYPSDWSLRTIYGSQLMKGPDPQRGETILREQLRTTPNCDDAHLRLGTLLKHQGRRDDARQVFEEAVRRWPWHHQAVDSCVWLATEGMTQMLPAQASGF